jgi:2-(1,2-epoxy-1,2-dihydrophenyl)acetyl-CoA isomerase
MPYDCVKVKEEGGVVTVTLSRPEKLNALAGHMRRDLSEALERAGSDANVRVVVITGEGRAFCAGGDVAVMNELMEKENGEEFARLLGAGRRVVTAIRGMTKPVLAAINGPATGAGFNLALACDLRIATESSKFSQSFARVGLHPDWGGTFFLPQIVPPNIACELFFLGDLISAEQALRWGLLNRVVPDAELEAETKKLAQRLAAAPTETVAAVKHAVYMTLGGATLDRMLQYETEAQTRCFRSRDGREGVKAFLEKRPPRFAGR